MSGSVVELYTDADVERLRRKIRMWAAGLGAVGVLALGACIAMAASATTLTAEKMEISAILTSIFSGWMIIYCAIFVIGAARRELGHANTLRTSERERVEGRVSLNGERLRIKKSISARGVEVDTPDGIKRFWISQSRAAKLRSAEVAAVYISHGYVAAYEVSE